MDEKIAFQLPASSLNDFFGIKGGRSLSDLKDHIQPTVDTVGFLYPLTNATCGTIDVAVNLPLIGGRGIYRIRVVGNITALSAVGFSKIQFQMSTVATNLSIAGDVGVGVTQALAISLNSDFLLDLKTNPAETALSITLFPVASSATGGDVQIYVTAQRVA